MLRTRLDSDWRFTDFAPDAGDPQALSQVGLDTATWHALSLPGDVNAALVRDDRMPDPHYADNARQCYWVTAREWWLRAEFACPAEQLGRHADLCLDGVDGHADVYLNGQLLGRTENAFRLHRFDVSGLLQPDQPNVLALRFRSIDQVMGGPRADELAGWRRRRVLMRKPQFSFGWDWSLPLPSIGVMGGVWLEHHGGPRLVDVSVQSHLSGRLDWKFRVNTAARDAGYHLDIRVQGHGADVAARVERPGRCYSHLSLDIPDPALWWPNGLGEPALYDYAVDLVVGGQVVESRAGRLGIREVEILEEPFTPEAGPGISFWLKVNGQRVFCKGGNWIPLELWPAEATDEQYDFYLHKTAEANFNMLRIWGGGIYERPIFYDLCDELGIMVWQDFMFASAGYPVDLLRQEIIAEAQYQLRRLRNRPCITLWCGCNEDVYSWSLPNEEAESRAMADTGVYSESGGDLQVNRLRDDPEIYTMILRGLTDKLGLGVPYVESSPQSHEDAGNLPESGNHHLSCWKWALFESQGHPEQFRKHFDVVQSYDSEFCIQGPCNVETLRSFLPAASHWPPDDMWIYHIQRGHANLPHYEQTLRIAGAIFGEINSLQEYVKHGQATHVEMMRGEFESARRDRPNNGGAMMWMYNDCWPTSNWSIIDYYRRPKPSYYAAKRACAPQLPIIMERRGEIGFFFSNDGAAPVQATIRFGQAGLDGRELWAQEQSVRVGPVETARLHTVRREDLGGEPGSYLFAAATVDGRELPVVTFFPDGWKEIPWPAVAPRLELLRQERQGEGWLTEVRVAAEAYTRLCHLLIPEEAGAWWLDDSFFDLPAGASRTVAVWSERPFAVEGVRVGDWHTTWK